MRLRKLFPLILLLASAARVSAQAPEGHPPRLRLSADRLLAPPAATLRLGLAPLPPAYLADLPSWPGPLALDSAAQAMLASGARSDVTGDLPLDAPVDAPVERDTGEGGRVFRELELPEVVQEVTNLGLRVEGRGALGGEWRQFRPCETGLDLNCNPDLLPRLQPDMQFGIQVGGTITDRIHVNVDYDQRREFDAANNISVHYQGEPGELLQRVEMGDVSIDLPASRYLTQGIPAGNFGFKTTARFGAMDVSALWAQQKGDIAAREFRLGGGQAGLVQDQELVLDDADYASGQFFFLVGPTELEGWPDVDVIELDREAAPARLRPRPDRLALYRDNGVTMQRYTDQAQAGTFLADAVTADGELRHSGLFNLLEPGQDYYMHPSGLWIALRAPLRDDEALAVAYVSETGLEVGDPNAEAAPSGETPELRLVRGPITVHQPGQPTWLWEMHQVYRLDSSAQVEPSSLDLVISLGHVAGGETFKEYAGRPIPLLRLFGLDDDAPTDVVDLAHLFRPGADFDALGPSGLRGTFLIFPTLEPFGRPPPVPSEGLSALEAGLVLGSDANPAIYEAVDPVVRRSSSRFRLNFRYQVQLEGLLSSFNLGAFGIRQGSERVTVDDRLLVRGVDYVVDYDLGVVTLLDPAATLGGNPDAEIRASWEQKSLFDIAPTTVFGLNAAAPLGAYGDINLMGMYQSQQTVVRRPQLGAAPGAVLLGGASGRLAFQADWLTRALRSIPGLSVDSVARLDVRGEMAFSDADPNRTGATYLDDFEATDELSLSLGAADWQVGSVPEDVTAFPMGALPLTTANASPLVWQDRYRVGERDVGFLTPREIDEQIAFAGARLAEPVLYLTMGGGPGETPEWRSITTALSTTGQDLSRSEFLEFYAAPMAGPTNNVVLVVDIGTVSEDAFYFGGSGELGGIDQYGRPWGEGVLDAEARLDRREVWGPENDRRGIWNQMCQAERIAPVPLGDFRANCTVLNGRPDSEDLNANGVLDATDGPSFRYVIPLTSSSPYLVRGQAATGTPFRLFRVPLKGGGALPLAGATEATWRYVKHIRMTMVKPAEGRGTLALARLRIAGSRWTKRDLAGVVSGRTGSEPGSGAATTTVRVGTVSRLTDGGSYTSPPGVADEIQDPKSAIGATGVEFNEKSLRLSWDELPGDERAEVYFRYPQQPRNFLEYREVRFWAVPLTGSWGPSGDHELLFKIGTDPGNYYIYRSSLNPVGTAAGVTVGDWLPEHVVDVEEWLALKAEAERRLAEGAGAGPVVIWSEDGRYGIVLEDRARAPNLAAVRELTFAVFNRGSTASTGEVWIDDLRLGDGATGPGFAGRMNVDLNAGGVFSAAVAVGGRGGRFRQLEGSASWETVNDLSVNTTTELGRFVPASWGVAMPLTVSYLKTDLSPIFLPGTDVRADRLPGLREAGTTRRRVGLSLRKTTPSSHPIVSALVDGTVLHAGHIRSSDATVTTARRIDGFDGGIQVDRRVTDVGVGVLPRFLEGLLRWLAPARVERSAFFDRVTDARLRLTPERVGFSAGYVQQDASVWRYSQVLESPRDLDVRAIESPRRALESGASIALRPLESLTARVGLISDRDVLDPARATPLLAEREALMRARRDIAGVPLGWERGRLMTTDASFRPAIADWLRPSVIWTSRFSQRRDPSHIEAVPTADSAVSELQRTFNGDRSLTRAVVFDLGGALRAGLLPYGPPPDAPLAGVRPGAPGGLAGALLAVVRPLKPVELTWTDEVGSRFVRELARPGLDYQVGLGGIDGFRYMDGDTAALALVRDGFRARSGVRIGSRASLDLGYTENDARVVDIGAGVRTQLERAWPDIQLAWTDVPVPAWAGAILDRWSVSTGFIRSERVTRLGSDVQRVRSQLERTVPLEFRLAFAGGIAFSYIGSFTTGDGEDPTGFTEQGRMSHAVGLSGAFPAPRPLRQAIPEPIRLSFSYDYQEQAQSRAGWSIDRITDPTAFIDYMNRRASLTLTSLISQMDVGLQGSYIDRRSFIGTRAGSSQFQLSLFGQFNVQAGEF